MNNILSQPVAIQLGWALVHFIWQGLLVGLLLELSLLGVGSRRAALRCLLCGLALAIMPVMLMATFLALHQQAVAAELRMQVNTGFDAQGLTLAGPSKLPIATQAPAQSLSLQQQLNRWMPFVTLSWLVGVAVLSARTAGGFYVLRRLRTRDVTEPDNVLLSLLRQACCKMGINPESISLQVSRRVVVPMTMGWFKPIILFPASLISGLSGTEIEMLLAHELAHIQRWDYPINLMQTAAETLFFYHPVTWWISHRMRQEREQACDDLVISRYAAPLPYAKALLRLEMLQAHTATLTHAANGGSLLQRVKRLLGEPGKTSPERATAIVIGLFLLVGVVIAMAEPPETNPSSPSTPPSPSPPASVPTLAPEVFDEQKRAKIEQKLTQIRLDHVKFDRADIQEVITYLNTKVRALDPEGQGVNFVVRLPNTAESSGRIHREITSVDLEDISVLNLLKIISGQTGLEYVINDDAVYLRAPGDEAELIARTYLAPGGLFKDFSGVAEFSSDAVQIDVTGWFKGQGVSFPVGARATYLPQSGKLVVRDTQDNLELIQKNIDLFEQIKSSPWVAYESARLHLQALFNLQETGKFRETLRQSKGLQAGFIELWKQVREELLAIQTEHPNWEKALVQARIQDCDHEIEELSGPGLSVSPAPMPNSPTAPTESPSPTEEPSGSTKHP